jgi:hypothetical protein
MRWIVGNDRETPIRILRERRVRHEQDPRRVRMLDEQLARLEQDIAFFELGRRNR